MNHQNNCYPYFKVIIYALRPIHTKEDDNYKDNDKDIVIKIVLNIKE